MQRMKWVVAAALLAFTMPSHAQIAVSAEDGKQLRPNDEIDHMTPDQVTIIDLNRYPPKVVATLDAPASMIGPPGAVAVAYDESFALVTAAQRVEAGDPPKLVPADTVSVIDIRKPEQARVVQTVHAGPGASGVAINRRGTLALVASTEDNTVSVFSIKSGRLTKTSTLQFPDGSRPCDVAFLPSGDRALVVRRGDHRISVLAVQGDSVTLTNQEVTPGRGPYGVMISPDGKFAFTNNLNGIGTRAEIDAEQAAARGEGSGGGQRPRRPGSVSAIDLTTMQVVAAEEVGQTPETVALSPDGRLLVVVIANGASVQKRAPNYSTVFGLLKIFKVDGGKLSLLSTIQNGHWCQGAAFSSDSKTLLVQCGSERNLEVYRIDGDSVIRDDAATIFTKSRGGSIATARSR